MIRDVELKDAAEIAAIYAYYVANTTISFEMEAPSVSEMRNRIERITRLYPWIVHEQDGRIDGYAYAGEYKRRKGYRYTTELAVYLTRDLRGKGVGSLLTRELLSRLRGMNYYTALACITYDNDRSVGMVEKLGFERVGVAKNVGRKFGKWLSVVDYALPLKDYADAPSDER